MIVSQIQDNIIRVTLPFFINCKKVIFLEYPFSRTVIYFYGPLCSSLVKLPMVLTVDFSNKTTILLKISPYAIWPINTLYTLPILFSKLILRRIQGTWSGYKKVMFLRGMGFKSFMNSGGFLVLKLGMTNKPRFLFDLLSFTIFIKKFQRILIKGLFYEETLLFLQKLRLFRIPDIYSGKGFFFKGQRFKLKRGKRKR